MIIIDYSDGKIKITTQDLKKIFNAEQLPLKFEIKKVISKEILWHTNLNSFMWATYPENEINDVVVTDAQGNFIYQYYWDVLQHGSIFYKSLWLYCKSLINMGKKPKGLVIGTHDGEFGEWVPLVKHFMSDMLLIEGSSEQYNKLTKNFQGKQGVNLLYDIITPNGGEVEFFEGGKGYTNSIVERVINYWEKEEIHSTKRNSTSLNQIIEEKFNGHLDWIHLDVEGLDAKLLMSINEKYELPKFIIFEDFNLPTEEKEEINKWLTLKGFSLHSENGICMATK